MQLVTVGYSQIISGRTNKNVLQQKENYLILMAFGKKQNKTRQKP